MVFSDPNEGSDGAIRMVRQIYMEDPDLYFYPDQYNNPANWKAHFEGTGPEIIKQTDGAHHALRHRHGHQRHLHGHHPPPEARPARSEVLLGAALQRLPRTGRPEAHAHRHRPGFYDDTMADGNLWIETEDAYKMVRRLAREEGLLVGISSGCNVHAATLLAREIAARGESGVSLSPCSATAPRSTSANTSGTRNDPHRIRTLGGHGGARPRAAYPNECCGAMLGSIDGETKTVRVAIAAARTPSKARRPRATSCGPRICWPPTRPPASAGMDLIGIYHSHPDCDAYFSKTDLQNSCPWYSFVVLSIQKGEFDHANSWLPNFDQTEAAKEELIY